MPHILLLRRHGSRAVTRVSAKLRNIVVLGSIPGIALGFYLCYSKLLHNMTLLRSKTQLIPENGAKINSEFVSIILNLPPSLKESEMVGS